MVVRINSDSPNLLHYVILNRAAIPETQMLPNDVIVHIRSRRITGHLLEEWTRTFWKRRPGTQYKSSNAIVIGAFFSLALQPQWA
jgi:hypothetical protein